MGARRSSAFGALLRSYRIATLQSQEALAERSGLSARGIGDLERGVSSSPRLETVRMLADGLGLNDEDRADFLAAARSTTRIAPADVGMEDAGSPLPQPLTPLVGRAEEVAHLRKLLGQPTVRLVTITGPGGVGKSRLALQVAAGPGPQFTHGAHFVELAPIADPDLVASAVAQHLDVREAHGKTLTDKVILHLRSHHALLVLDNFEHVLPAAHFVTAILGACPHVTILATSRAPLHVRGEREWHLSPLTLPTTSIAHDPGAVAETDAVRLFVDRATAVLPGFALTEVNAREVAEICHRVDGLPLALELAAARMNVLSPDALLSRLKEHRLAVLTRGARDLPSRQQTMHKTISWSHDLLGPSERTLFRRLSVFAGGWTLDAAEAVANLHGDLDVLDTLSELVNGSLVRHHQEARAGPRFEMLETVREFGLEQLVSSGEDLETRKRHAAWMLDLVRDAAPGLLVEDHASWMARLEDELANQRAARAHTLQQGDIGTTLQLTATPWLYWFESGRTNEARSWLVHALTKADGVPLPTHAMARFAAGSLAATQGDYGPAISLLEAALEDWTEVGDKQGIARTRHSLATVALEQNEDQRAARLLEQVLADYGGSQTGADASWVALAVTHLACAYSGLGEHDRATALGEEAVSMQQAAGSQMGIALGRTFLADFALERGDYDEAHREYLRGLTMMWNLGDRWHLLYALTGFGIVLAELGPLEQAVRVLGAQWAAREAYGNRISPRRRVAYDAAVVRMREALGQEAFSQAWSAGMGLSLHEAVSEILENQAGIHHAQ